MPNRIAAVLLMVTLVMTGCSSKAQSGSGCKVTPPTRTFTANGQVRTEMGSESFFYRDGGVPWVATQPHKTVWFMAKADRLRDLTVSGEPVVQTGEKAAPVVLLHLAGATDGIATSITIPTPGCWRLSADLGGQKIDAVIHVGG